MKINILYFAQLGDLAGHRSEIVQLDDPCPKKLYGSLREQYGFPHEFTQIQVAINHELSAHETELQDGDSIAFLPPMTGG
ncbi:MAG: MoaD/ThiS family protein [Opitutales bacterium]|jgi:molybdopterin converting factor small subunit